MKTRELTNEEMAKLLFWCETTGRQNWGGWGNYPLSGCKYLSFDDSQVVVKFDSLASYQGEIFTHLKSARCKDRQVLISRVQRLYGQTGDATLESLRNDAQASADKEKQKRADFSREYREKAISGELSASFMREVEGNVKSAVESARHRDAPHGKVIGDTFEANGCIYLGSSATALYTAERCKWLRDIEDAVKAATFTFTVVSKSNTGKTRYGLMTDESTALLNVIVGPRLLACVLFNERIEKAKTFEMA